MGFGGSGGLLGGFLGGGGGSSGSGGFNGANGKVFCASSDPICGIMPGSGGSGSESLTGSHLSYSSNGAIPKAVQFIISKVKA